MAGETTGTETCLCYVNDSICKSFVITFDKQCPETIEDSRLT